MTTTKTKTPKTIHVVRTDPKDRTILTIACDTRSADMLLTKKYRFTTCPKCLAVLKGAK